MKRSLLAVAVMVTALGFGQGLRAMAADDGAKDMAMEKAHAAAVTTSLFVCPHCHTAAMKAGKCACGQELTQSHLLGVEKGQASVCSCGADCKCDAKGAKEGKCACGKEVGKVSLKGLYACPAGCPVISEAAGKCGGCGKDLAQAE